MGSGYVIFDNPENSKELYPVFQIDLDKDVATDLRRYSTKLFYDSDIPIDYNKVIKISLEEYLKKHIGDLEVKEIAKIRTDETKRIEEAKIKAKPDLPWDLGKKKGKI